MALTPKNTGPTEKLSPEALQKLAEKGRESFFFFTRAILGFSKLTTEIHKPLCDMLQDFNTNTRLGIILPRGWYKSTICTIAYPLWRAVCNPEVRVLLVQNTYTNACGKLSAIKQIVETNQLFKLLYPEILPTKDSIWSADTATVSRRGAYPEGTFEAAGTGTQKTGQHYDLIIEDDTVSPDKDNLSGAELQPTQAEIEKAIGWFRLGDPLLIEPLQSQRIVVGTRWAERDLLGYLIEKHPEFKIVTRAVRETNNKPDVNGTIVWPERFNEQVLRSLETSLGPYPYCNPAEAPILMGDFTEKSIESVQVGDEVVGFKLGNDKVKSALCKAIVTNKGSLIAKTVFVQLSSGNVIRCTPEHQWLMDPHHHKVRSHITYRPICKPGTLDLNIGRHNSKPCLYRVCDEAKINKEPEDLSKLGWLGGMLDADGHVSNQGHIVFSQSETANEEICDDIRRNLAAFDFEWGEFKRESKSPRSDKTGTGVLFTLKGGFEEKRRFLLNVPARKCQKIIPHLYKSRFVKYKDEVVAVHEGYEEKVYWLETTTGNYVCWGYASKNSALYMNCPTSASNQVFQREWIKYYQTNSPYLYYVTSVDLASAKMEESGDPDYNVIMTCGIDPSSGEVFVTHYKRARMSPSAVINEIFEHFRIWKPVKVIIEGIGYQRTIQHFLELEMRKRNQFFAVEMITGYKNSKADRIRGLQPWFAAGQVFLRTGMDELERELLAFPKGSHDDLCDALSMQLEFWNHGSSLIAEEREKANSRNNPFTFESIIEADQKRHKSANRYPYDQGILRYNLPSYLRIVN